LTILRVVPKINGSKTTISGLVDRNIRATVYYDYAGDFVPSNKGLANAATIAFLPYAMQNSLDLHVEGAVDSDLLVQLEEAQDAWVRWHPSLFRPIRITAEEVRAATLATTSTAIAAFSGGLDATYAVHAHKRQLIGRRSLDIRAGVLVQGFDLPLDKPEWFDNAKQHAAAILSGYDVALITVRTNWRSLESPWEQAHIFGVASVLHQFNGAFGHAVIAADDAYDGEILGWGSNSITNQMMGGSSFPIRFTGAGRSRTEKAGIVGQEPEVLNHLRVCWEHPEGLGNCGRCEKCIRTKLNFMANGITEFPTLGPVATPQQVRKVMIMNETVLSLFRDVAGFPWTARPEIKAALSDLIKRGIYRPSPLKMTLRRYQKSLKKRGLWFK
jgi:hypothetical protein